MNRVDSIHFSTRASATRPGPDADPVRRGNTALRGSRRLHWIGARAKCLSVSLALAGIVLLGLVRSAGAIVIDDFETGTFDLVAFPGSPVSAVIPVVSPVHCIAGQRDVRLFSLGTDAAGAQLHLGALDDEVQMVMPAGGGGQLYLRYATAAPVDLTGGGMLDRIELTLTVAVSGATLEVTLGDNSGASSAASEPVTLTGGPVTYTIFLSEFGAALDLTAIQSVQVALLAPLQGDFHLSDIRVTKGSHAHLVYDATVTQAGGPPYPTTPLVFDVKVPPNPIFPPNPIHSAQLSLLQASNCLPPDPCTDLPIKVLGTDSGMGLDRYGPIAGALFHWAGGPGIVFPAGSNRFDLCLALRPTGALTPTLPAPPRVVAVREAFALYFRVEYMNSDSKVVATSDQEMIFDIGEGQPLHFTDVQTPPDPCLVGAQAAGPGAALRMSFGVEKDGDPDPALPLFQATITGDVLWPALVAVGDPPAPSELRLWAQPSLMRSHTEFRLGRSLDRPAPLEVFDVLGRAVRRLEIPRGGSSVIWDGRDGSGGWVPAGVYLARLADRGARLVARVVRLD